MQPVDRIAGRFVSVCGQTLDSLRGPGEPALACLAVDETDATPLGTDLRYSGRGFGVRPDDTRVGALGETFERYCLGLPGGGEVEVSTAELTRRGVPHVSPARLLHLPPGGRQGSLAPVPGPDQPVRWLAGLHLGTGESTLVPARFCLMVERAAVEAGDGDWYRATSNGAAAAESPDLACARAVLELLERDAFMLMWYHRLRFPFLTVEPGSRLAHRIAAAVGPARLEVRLIDLSEVHGVPVVIGAVRGAVHANVQVGIGGGADVTVVKAAWKAAKEAIAYYAWQRKQIARGTVRTIDDPNDIRSFGDHVMYYLDPGHQQRLEFLFDDGAPRRPRTPDPPQETTLAGLVERLRTSRTDLYAVDLTPPGFDAFGLATVKVVSPDLVPLDWDYQARHLSYPRLRTEPARRGWRPDVPTIEELNHDPHPFP